MVLGIKWAHWCEVFLIGDVCVSTSFLRLNSGVWVPLFVSVVEFLWLSIKWDSWGCCQTISGIGWSLVIFGLSIAAPEKRRGIFSLNFGLQPEQFHSNHFDWFFLGPDSVFPVFYAREAVYWLHWLHSSTSLWSSLFSHMSYSVDKQFLSFS